MSRRRPSPRPSSPPSSSQPASCRNWCLCKRYGSNARCVWADWELERKHERFVPVREQARESAENHELSGEDRNRPFSLSNSVARALTRTHWRMLFLPRAAMPTRRTWTLKFRPSTPRAAQRPNRGIDLEFRWCLRTVETVSGARTIEKVFWKATGHVRVVGTFHRPNRPLETYRSYESRTKRKSILCNAGNVSESRVDEAVAGVSTAVRACILLAKLEH